MSEQKISLIPVILSGGSGSRLWPLSRQAFPKQFFPLVGEETLLQQTAKRAQAINPQQAPIVICNQEHRFLVTEQLDAIEIKPAKIILEPVGKNTAPAATIAALLTQDLEPEAILVLLAADHVISDEAALLQAIDQGKIAASQGALVVFGIQPERPDTNYGYIKIGNEFNKTSYYVEQFVEKPNIERATQYIKEGGYYWNSGMFMFQAKSFLTAIQEFAPEILKSCQQACNKITQDLAFDRLPEHEFSQCPNDSIDYAVMEKCNNRVMIPLAAGWSDVGFWASLFDVKDTDEQGNTIQGDVIAKDVHGSYLASHGRLLAAVGVKDIIVIETEDAVLIVDKTKSHEVKKIVEELKQRQRSEVELHKQVYRPWGYYETLVKDDRYQVKRIVVKSNKSLSLQMHHHRAEHWTVVRGTAYVTKDNETFVLAENESTYIPIGTKHRLENRGVIPLELIEVQTGSYLGEDDIVRFEDQYGRVTEKSEVN